MRRYSERPSATTTMVTGLRQLLAAAVIMAANALPPQIMNFRQMPKRRLLIL